jgi:hypothetical protein
MLQLSAPAELQKQTYSHLVDFVPSFPLYNFILSIDMHANDNRGIRLRDGGSDIYFDFKSTRSFPCRLKLR